MCLAIPVQLLALNPNGTADVELDGFVRPVSTALIDEPQIGDYVIVHSGLAIEKLSPQEAREILEAIAQAVIL